MEQEFVDDDKTSSSSESDEEEYVTSESEAEPEEGVAEDVDMRPHYSDDDLNVTNEVMETNILSGNLIKLTKAEKDLPLLLVSFSAEDQRRLLYDMLMRGFDDLSNLVYVSDHVLRSEAERLKNLCREISLQENPDDAAAGEIILNLPHTQKLFEIVQQRSSSF